MSWTNPENRPPKKNVTPLPRKENNKVQDGQSRFYGDAIPQAAEAIREASKTMQVIEQEKTKRESIEAWRQAALNAISAGTEEVQNFINQEYAERMTFQEGYIDMMKTLISQGDTQAALELGRMMLERSSDREMLRDLVAHRNHRASIGMIDMRIVEPEK